jgi:KDO2-lipid IV(A) lauroyltransferase
LADAPPTTATQKKPKLRHWMEYAGYRLTVGILNLLPEGLALGIGGAFGWGAGTLLRVRWQTVMEHLRHAFPEKDEEWRRRLARASFRHLGRESVATFRLSRMGAAEVRARTDLVGWEAVLEAWSQGKGLIIATGHFGNWEMGGSSVVAHGIPCDAVVQAQRNPLFDADLVAVRKRLGLGVIERKTAPKKVIRSLRKGRSVGILGDQNVRRGGVFVEFFGKLASTPRGVAIFALRTGAPVFLGMARSLPGLPQRYQVSFKPVEFTPSGETEEDILRFTELYARLLEEVIREAPEQYFWQHRRWKTRPTEEVETLD